MYKLQESKGWLNRFSLRTEPLSINITKKVRKRLGVQDRGFENYIPA